MLRRLVEPLRKNGRFDLRTALGKGRISTVSAGEGDVSWVVTNSNDEIQRSQLTTGYYEFSELAQLKADVGQRSTVLDVGANIGNHSIYFIKEMGCRQLIAVEPFPSTYRHLLANLSVNIDGQVDIRLIAAALSDRAGQAAIIPPTDFNVGLTKVDASRPGSVVLVTGDSVVGDASLDLIKIDVEGMEHEVLAGLSSVLRVQRPALYVEVASINRQRILHLMATANYRVARETSAYTTQSNFTFLPN